MKKIYSFMLCAVFALTACETNEDGSVSIKLEDGTPTEIVINPEDSNKGSNIKFVATAPWTAEVKELASTKAGEDNSTWLKLSQYRGEAGTTTITVTFNPNETGEVRKAEIIIRCGDSEIVITIEQKPVEGTNPGEGGDKPVAEFKKIKQIVRNKEYTSELVYNPDAKFEKVLVNFEYDDKGRLSYYEITEKDYGGRYYYYYYTMNQISVRAEVKDNEGNPKTENYLVNLNDKGLATKLQVIGGEDLDNMSFAYTKDGCIERMTYYVYDVAEPYDMMFYYDKGYLTEIKDISTDESMKFDIPKFYPNNNPNNNMLDMLYFYDLGIGIDFLYPAGCLGRTGNYFLEYMIDTKDKSDVSVPGQAGGYKESEGYKPGQVVREFESKSYDRTDDYCRYECEFDKDKNITKVTSYSAYNVFKEYYEEYITDKFAIREGVKYYWSSTRFKNKVKTDEGMDKDIYTITYVE